ncbi:MAG: DUF6176 family protein [Rhabdochlamydiaceae bacterium]
MMKINLFKIEKGKLEKWLEWGHCLMTEHQEEAVETLKEEGLIYEGFCVSEVAGNYYTLAMIEGYERPTNMERELNQKHREVKRDCLDKLGPVEKAYELYAEKSED